MEGVPTLPDSSVMLIFRLHPRSFCRRVRQGRSGNRDGEANESDNKRSEYHYRVTEIQQ